jgi:hypothetical protein
MPDLRTTALRYALSLMAAAALDAAADQPSPGTDPGLCEALRTINATGNRIWVTVYDLGKTRHLDFGWVEPCSVRVWRSGSYACGSYYYVRAEVKDYYLTRNVYDTTVQHNPQGLNYGSWVETLRRKGDNYYWEHGNTAGCTPNGINRCCGADYQDPQGYIHYEPQSVAPLHVDVTFKNELRVYVAMHIYTTWSDGNLKDDCVAPQSEKTWQLPGDFEYRMRAELHEKACKDGKPLKTYVGIAKTDTKTAKGSITLYRDPKTKYVEWK